MIFPNSLDWNQKNEMLEHHQHLTFSDFLSLNLAVFFPLRIASPQNARKIYKTHTHNIDIMMINAHYKHAFWFGNKEKTSPKTDMKPKKPLERKHIYKPPMFGPYG